VGGVPTGLFPLQKTDFSGVMRDRTTLYYEGTVTLIHTPAEDSLQLAYELR
jgi:hypothetical protein